MVVKRIRLAVSHDAVIRIDVSHNRHFTKTKSSTLPIADYTTFWGGKIEKTELRRERCPDLVSPHYRASDYTKIFNPITQTTRLPRKYLLLCHPPRVKVTDWGFAYTFSVSLFPLMGGPPYSQSFYNALLVRFGEIVKPLL